MPSCRSNPLHPRPWPCRSARKRRSLPECLPASRTGFTRALAVPERPQAPEPAGSLPDGRTGFTRALAVPERPPCAGACRRAFLTVEPASPVPWPCRSARKRRSLPTCLPDGRTGFTRALAVPERSPSAGASRSLPDGRTGFTRALAVPERPQAPEPADVPSCRSNPLHPRPGRAGAPDMRRSLPTCLPDGRTGFTRALAVPERPPCAGACRRACLTVESASPVPWPCRSARKRRSLPTCLPDGRTRFTRALAVPERPTCAGACRRAFLTVEPASPAPWPCRSARHAPEPAGVPA